MAATKALIRRNRCGIVSNLTSKRKFAYGKFYKRFRYVDLDCGEGLDYVALECGSSDLEILILISSGTSLTSDEFVYFGATRCAVIRPTTIIASGITISVKDSISNERLSFRIAFKHILRAWISEGVAPKGLVLLVSPFCARSVRDNLNISEPNLSSNITFDPQHSHAAFKYLIIDIHNCSMENLLRMQRILDNIQRLRTSANINSQKSIFFSKMREVHYHNLLAEIETVSSSYVSFSDQPSTTLSPLSQAQSTFNGQGTVHQPQRNCVQQSSMYYILKTDNNVQRCPSPAPNVSDSRSTKSTVYSSVSNLVGRPSTFLHTERRTNFFEYMLNSSQRSKQYSTGMERKRYFNPFSTERYGSIPSSSGNMATKKMKMDLENRIVHTIDEDEASSSTGQKLYFSVSNEANSSHANDILMLYPQGERGAISLHFADVEYLKPDQMLNDSIIDFFLKFIHRELIPKERRSSIFIFNSFFYARLTQTSSASGDVFTSAATRSKWVANNYKSVRNWTKNVDIFDMEYVVVPINEDIHCLRYLAIIVRPGSAISAIVNESCNSSNSQMVKIMNKDYGKKPEKNEYQQKQCLRFKKAQIIIFDSLVDGHFSKRRHTATILRDYLECEFNDKKKDYSLEQYYCKERIEKILPRFLPQQKNYTDCGLFLLKYSYLFLLRPPLFILHTDSFMRWYPQFTIDGMRNFILDKIKSLCNHEKWVQYEEFSKRFGCEIYSSNMSSSSLFNQLNFVSMRSASPLPLRRTLSADDIESSYIRNISRRAVTP
ncbi:unnamed protein product [Dracunculus medinensis]|uniref:ULP_PROTEASE domain-containing protein n=1 Tax=Dracunculus medinensis TaxID=318479 RepID=A0A158Q4N4_DRAME|nr:unnamed protein product [Dracunculus medinensis]